MSTRGRLGIQLSDDSILSVYHHMDSFPEGLGKILKKHYNTYESVCDLVNGGDMSHCYTKRRWTYEGDSIEVEEYGPQYYVRQIDGECPPVLDENLEEYLSDGEEYAYVFSNGEWTCYDLHGDEPQKLQIPQPVAA